MKSVKIEITPEVAVMLKEIKAVYKLSNNKDAIIKSLLIASGPGKSSIYKIQKLEFEINTIKASLNDFFKELGPFINLEPPYFK